jgi:hypothetical protein
VTAFAGPVVPGSMNVAAAWSRPAEPYAKSSDSTAVSAVANAGTWIDWNVAGSRTEAGVGPADPAIPGNAPRARAAVSAAPATILEGRTIRAR